MKQARHLPALPICIGVAVLSILLFKRYAARVTISRSAGDDAQQPQETSQQRATPKDAQGCQESDGQPSRIPGDAKKPPTNYVCATVLALVTLFSFAVACILGHRFFTWGFLVSVFSSSNELLIPSAFVVLVVLLSPLKGLEVVQRLKDSIFQWWLKHPFWQIIFATAAVLMFIVSYWITNTCTPPKWDQFVLAICEGDRGDYGLAQANWEELKAVHPVQAQLLGEVLEVYQARSANSHLGSPFPSTVTQRIHSLSQKPDDESPYLKAARTFALAEALHMSLDAEPLEEKYESVREARANESLKLLDELKDSPVNVVPPRLRQAAVGNQINVMCSLLDLYQKTINSPFYRIRKNQWEIRASALLESEKERIPDEMYLGRNVLFLGLVNDYEKALKDCGEWLRQLRSPEKLRLNAIEATDRDPRQGVWLRNAISRLLFRDGMLRMAGSNQINVALYDHTYLLASHQGLVAARDWLTHDLIPLEAHYGAESIQARFIMTALAHEGMCDDSWIDGQIQEQSKHRSILGNNLSLLRGLVLLKAGNQQYQKAFADFAGFSSISVKNNEGPEIDYVIGELKKRSNRLAIEVQNLIKKQQQKMSPPAATQPEVTEM